MTWLCMWKIQWNSPKKYRISQFNNIKRPEIYMFILASNNRKFDSSSLERSVGRKVSLPHTNKRITNLKTKND